LGEQVVGDVALHGLSEDFLCGGDRGIGGGGAHVGQGLRLGLGDLGFRHPGAARDELVHPRLGFGSEPLGLGLGAGEDLGGLALGGLLRAPVFGQERGGLILEAARLVELAADAGGALVERVQEELVDAEVDQYADEDHEGDGDPGFGFSEHLCPQRLSTSATAASTSRLAGADPVRRCTIAPAASVAMPLTLVMAADRRAPEVFSASATVALRLASSALRALSAAAASLARVSLASACARLRASASDFSYAAKASSASFFSRSACAKSPSMCCLRSVMIEPMR